MQTEIYFNTIPLSGSELQTATDNAASQEHQIAEFFRLNPRSEFSPPTIMELMDFSCLNSVRRAITTLCKKGVLRKTGNRVSGRFGVPNNCWQYNNEN